MRFKIKRSEVAIKINIEEIPFSLLLNLSDPVGNISKLVFVKGCFRLNAYHSQMTRHKPEGVFHKNHFLFFDSNRIFVARRSSCECNHCKYLASVIIKSDQTLNLIRTFCVLR